MLRYQTLDTPKTKAYMQAWSGIFFLFLVCIGIGLYSLSIYINYTWHWEQVAQYFAYKETATIKSDYSGNISNIEIQGKNAVITITSDNETKHQTLLSKGLTISKGDYIYTGDIIAKTTSWKIGELVKGLWVTIKISCLGILIGIFIGIFTGLARISRNPMLRWIAITYIEIVRGSPLLVQIFLWYFVIGKFVSDFCSKAGIATPSPFLFGAVALALFAGAYVAEIIRAGIQSVPRGQMEAARSLGMTNAQTMRKIILPQAFNRILPPLAGQFISLIKDSSLLGVISVRELTKGTREIVSSTMQPFEFWIVCAVLYLLLTFLLSLFVHQLEKRATI